MSIVDGFVVEAVSGSLDPAVGTDTFDAPRVRAGGAVHSPDATEAAGKTDYVLSQHI
ncbi:hypothetical protein SCNU_09476 [Gordonia neofelifaecis NRRL B-59395]|uniref:Uncharacterized protein n=1 Tax=Gordonia neofelifaecis NRRL B-59395 TaxID=644548 RepID=F1YJ21_9ACTN|nr:hypothetical protein SCNU_09476 [Gordonia neofelifaecis NRRL B-59395]